MKHYYVSAPLIQVISQNEGAVLLDLQTDRYFGLDQMGLLVWSLLVAGKSQEEVVSQVRKRYPGASEEAVAHDIAQFASKMQEQQLLFPGGTVTCVHRADVSAYAKLFLFLSRLVLVNEWLEAWMLLSYVQKALQHGKLLDLTRRWKALPAHRTVGYDDPLVRRLASRVQSVACWQAFEARCLHQNLVLMIMLRRRSVRADLVISIDTHPFLAHAWLRSAEAINWQVGIGPGVSLQRLQQLPVIFSSGSEL